MSYTKPLPVLDGHTKDFYEWCKKHELRFQQCTSCGTWRHVPRELCAECGSWDWEWMQSSGRGTVFTWTVAERPLHPAFASEAPYASVVVAMDEGVRILTDMVDCPPDQIEMDMPVEVVFDDVTPEITLPRFRRAR